MRLFKIKSPLRIPGGFAKIFAMVIIIMARFAMTGANKTSALTDNYESQTQLCEISIGDTIRGKLDATDVQLNSGQFCDEYTFGGIGGQEIIISLSTFDFDAFLWLLDSEGKTITINDDTGDAMGSVISKFALPYSGPYTLWVSSYSSGETGDYSLTLNEAPLIDSSRVVFIGDKVKVKKKVPGQFFSCPGQESFLIVQRLFLVSQPILLANQQPLLKYKPILLTIQPSLLKYKPILLNNQRPLLRYKHSFLIYKQFLLKHK